MAMKKFKRAFDQSEDVLSRTGESSEQPEIFQNVQQAQYPHLIALADKWDARASEIEVTAKAYSCRSMDQLYITYIKQAERLRMCAAQLRAALEGDADAT